MKSAALESPISMVFFLYFRPVSGTKGGVGPAYTVRMPFRAAITTASVRL